MTDFRIGSIVLLCPYLVGSAVVVVVAAAVTVWEVQLTNFPPLLLFHHPAHMRQLLLLLPVLILTVSRLIAHTGPFVLDFFQPEHNLVIELNPPFQFYHQTARYTALAKRSAASHTPSCQQGLVTQQKVKRRVTALSTDLAS